ncbi:MAG: hypothetical protein JSV25_11280 [Spirochaetota bacterium]|nr:MAG: hypothetical protein JSV25_11280 [Spirochaetota bacterium]
MRKVYYLLLCALLLTSCGLSRTDLFHIASSDLQVYNFDPENSGLPIPVNAIITVAFNAVMDKRSVEEAFSLEFGGEVYTSDDGWFQWFAWDSAFAFHFDPYHLGGDFYYPPAEAITVRISGSARNEDGYYLIGGHEWTFITSTDPAPDSTPPDVLSWSFIYSEEISVNGYVEIQFSEPMMKSTATHGFILATPDFTTDVRSIEHGYTMWFDNNKTMRYYPFKPLQIGRDYGVFYNILGIIPRDLAGNELAPADHIHPYPSLWDNSIRLTVDSAKVQADVTDFPVYVDLSAMTVTAPTFFADCDPTGSDIIIIDEKRTSKLPRELVYFEAGPQQGELWFKASKLSSTEDTVFYLLYNSPASETNDPAVWSNGYLGVYHLHGGITDSSPNAYDGVSFPGVTDELLGKIGEAQNFDGMGSYFEIPVPELIGDSGTVSMWIKPWSWINQHKIFDVTLLPREFFLDILSLNPPELLRFRITDDMDNVYEVSKDVTGFPPDTWHHVAGVWQFKPVGEPTPAGAAARLYFDGFFEEESSSVTAERPPFQTPFIGTIRDPGEPLSNFWGDIDEVHISSKRRSPGWIMTEYNNQNAPWQGGFYKEIFLEP